MLLTKSAHSDQSINLINSKPTFSLNLNKKKKNEKNIKLLKNTKEKCEEVSKSAWLHGRRICPRRSERRRRQERNKQPPRNATRPASQSGWRSCWRSRPWQKSKKERVLNLLFSKTRWYTSATAESYCICDGGRGGAWRSTEWRLRWKCRDLIGRERKRGRGGGDLVELCSEGRVFCLFS